MTIGIDFKNKNINIDGNDIKMQLWDTAGQERFKTISVSYFRRAHGIALLYDVSNTQSFEHIPNWLDSVAQNTMRKVPLILIGNKCDLALKVKVEEGKQMAEDNGVPFFLTSAKTGEGVEEAFTALARMVLKDQGQDDPQDQDSFDIKENTTGEKKKCC
ncbi:Ras- protein Rab-13 [Tritrichomonas musculus]|uniref:Ras- protein Rab-13 n=1 Tax=Tritrichomonas musculus TaxID=1915356 RepID=A0ABR2JCP4_9EUKA